MTQEQLLGLQKITANTRLTYRTSRSSLWSGLALSSANVITTPDIPAKVEQPLCQSAQQRRICRLRTACPVITPLFDLLSISCMRG